MQKNYPSLFNKKFTIFIVIFSGLFTTYFYVWLKQYYYHYDDAFITYNFSKYLSMGYGFVFHPTLSPTQGSSSFLYTIILAICNYLIPVDTHIIGAFLSILSYIFLLLGIVGLASISNCQLPNKTKLYIFVTGLFFQQPLLFSFGLETICINAIMLWTIYSIVKKKNLMVMVLLSAIPLMRLDYMFYLPFFFLTALIIYENVKKVIILFCPCFILSLSYVIFAKIYFGDYVPHSWIAKMYFPPTVSGVLNWGGFLKKYPFLLGVIFISLGVSIVAFIKGKTLFFSHLQLKQRPLLVILSGFCFVSFLYTLILQYKGAPNMPWCYVTPIIFVYSLLICSLNQQYLQKMFIYYAVTLTLVFFNVMNSLNISDSFVNERVNKLGHNDRREKIGIYLRDNIPNVQQKIVLCFEVGKIPYYSGAKVYDILGLVSPEGIQGLKERNTTITLTKIYPEFVIGVNNPNYPPMQFLTDQFFISNYAKLHQIDDYIIWAKVQ